MEIRVKQETLAKALNNVSRVAAGAKTTLPILSNVLIRVDDGKVTLTTTNLDMAMVDYLPTISAENGVITVPARLLADFVSNLPRGEVVKLATDGTKMTVQAGEYSSVMNGAVADEFPELPAIDDNKVVKVVVPVENFKESLAKVMMAVSNDTTRPSLTGVYFNVQNNDLSVVATDGYRLAKRKLINGVEAEVAVIVPGASLRHVLALLSDEMDEIEILFDDAQVHFRMGEMEITSKLLSGVFPDYQQIIPKTSEVNLEVPREELLRITKLAALFAHEVSGSVTCMAVKERGALVIASVVNELGESSSEVKTEIDNDGKISLNARYFLDALNAMTGNTVRVRFSNNLDPMVIQSDLDVDYVHLVMPLRG